MWLTLRGGKTEMDEEERSCGEQVVSQGRSPLLEYIRCAITCASKRDTSEVVCMQEGWDMSQKKKKKIQISCACDHVM